MDCTIAEALTFFVSAKERDFCARVIGALQRVPTPDLGTLAVGVGPDGRYRLYYDPVFVAKTPMPKLRLIIKHELIHLVDDHIPRFLNLISGLASDAEKKRFRSVMNFAADFADNETIRTEKGFDDSPLAAAHFFTSETNPDGFLLPEMFKLPRKLPFEAYQVLMLDRQDKMQEMVGKLLQQLEQEGGDSDGQGDNPLGKYFQQRAKGAHKFWDKELDGRNPEELQGIADRAQQHGRNTVRQAYEEYQRDENSKNRGTMPAWLQERIEAFLSTPTIPWPRILRDLVMRTRQSKLARGMSRPNRRMYGVPDILPFPGRARDSRFTIWFALDTSGSMSKDDLRLGLEELIHIVQMEPEVQLVVLYCDADLHAVYDVDSMDDIDFTIKGRGGTDFNPPFVMLQEHMAGERAPDVFVYATDGYAPAPEPENRVPIPVIWLLTPNGAECSPDYGIHLRMVDQ